MATIRARKKADSTVSYTVQIRLKKKGVLVYQRSQTFARQQAPKPGRQMVGVADLHFRDLRHEGVSRLFEMDWVSCVYQGFQVIVTGTRCGVIPPR